MESWKRDNLSSGSRITPINHVLDAIPSYWLSASISNPVLQKNGEGCPGIHHVIWDVIRLPWEARITLVLPRMIDRGMSLPVKNGLSYQVLAMGRMRILHSIPRHL